VHPAARCPDQANIDLGARPVPPPAPGYATPKAAAAGRDEPRRAAARGGEMQ
jgi:hypothetical protein